MRRLLFLIFTYLYSIVFNSDDNLRNLLSSEYSSAVIDSFLQSKNKWWWLGYIIVPVLVLIRTTIIAFIIDMTTFFVNPEKEEVPFKKYWAVVLCAEWTVAAMAMAKFFWFGIFKKDYSFEELQSYVPFSIVNVINTDGMEAWLQYPLSLLSIWELMYWCLLIVGTRQILKTSWSKAVSTVFLSYGIGLLIWVAFVMYLTLNLAV